MRIDTPLSGAATAKILLKFSLHDGWPRAKLTSECSRFLSDPNKNVGTESIAQENFFASGGTKVYMLTKEENYDEGVEKSYCGFISKLNFSGKRGLSRENKWQKIDHEFY